MPKPFYVTDHAGGSEVYTSAEDLVRFGLFHTGTQVEGQKAVLSASSLEAMRQRGPGSYGLGWSVNPDWNGRSVIWHSGSMPGVSATLWVVPSERIAIALVANKAGAPVNQIAGEILGDLLGVAPPTAAPGQRPDAERTPRDASIVGRWRGVLHTCAGGDELVVDIRDASLAPQVVNRGEGGPTYQFDLRPEGSRLLGTVRRTTSPGPRGSNSVTLPLTLERVAQ